jgi:hypothetical protein
MLRCSLYRRPYLAVSRGAMQASNLAGSFEPAKRAAHSYNLRVGQSVEVVLVRLYTVNEPRQLVRIKVAFLAPNTPSSDERQHLPLYTPQSSRHSIVSMGARLVKPQARRGSHFAKPRPMKGGNLFRTLPVGHGEISHELTRRRSSNSANAGANPSRYAMQ